MKRAEAIRTDMRNTSKISRLRVVNGRESARRKRKVRPTRYRVPVNEDTRRFDPITHREGLSKRAVTALYIFAATLFHAAVFLGLMGFGGTPSREYRPDYRPEKVTVRVTEPEITPPKPIPRELPEPIPETPRTVVKPEQIPEPVKRPVQRKKAASRPNRRQAVTPPDVSPDPVDIPEQAQPSAEPRRRVVGISFESTVKSGGGPAFAVGNTRMGTTEKTAEDGTKVAPIVGRAYRPGGAKRPNGNTVSTAIPTAGVTLVKPKRRAAVQPVYPKVLRAQGIEGNVGVLIRINPDGRVMSAKIVKSSGYAAFDESALAAAEKERFSPAVRNGEPIEYTLKYTYRFRVKEQ